jgi:hypothetical protein
LAGPISQLDGVACAGPRACVAVGMWHHNGWSFPLALSWNGVSWTLDSTPPVRPDSTNELLGATCTSASACLAVGDYMDSKGNVSPEADFWNGRTWSKAQPVVPPGRGSPAAVTCTAPNACTAVGYTSFVETWNGKSWRLPRSVTGNPSDVLSSISCTSATSCEVVGTYEPGSQFIALAERWNGSSWSVREG